MAKSSISIGSAANDGTGDTLRSAGTKINSNFTELYNAFGDGSSLAAGISATGSTITLTSPVLDTPIIGVSLNDTNGNEFVKFTSTSSAINELTIANGASNDGPSLSATGVASNLNLTLTSKGTGSVEISKAAFSSITMTADGAVNATKTLIIGNKGSTLAVSLANGTTTGEYKIFINRGVGDMVVTPSNFAQGTSFTLAQNDGCTCVWGGTGTNWFLVGNQGEVTITT
jgi:hypothetical protein